MIPTELASYTWTSRNELLLRASRHALAGLLGDGLRDADISETERLVLLVSGGGDSVALLLLMAALRERVDPSLSTLAVLAIDHGLRAESAHEAAYAVEFARHLGVTHAEAVSVQVSSDGNVLDRARAARLRAAISSCTRFGSTKVLLAHQAEDRAEGALLALARGTTIDALANLLPTRAFVAESGNTIELVRPLLSARRMELRDFLRDLHVFWFDDPSNTRRARGALRGDPATAALIGRMTDGLGGLCAEAAELLAMRDALIEPLLANDTRSLPRSVIRDLHPAARGALLVRMVRSARGEIARATVTEALRHLAASSHEPKCYACRHDVELRIDARTVSVVRAADGEGSVHRSVAES